MNFIVDKEQLLKSVIIADSVVSSKNVNTLLNHCLFTVSKNSLQLSGTDNEIAIKNNIDVISNDSFSFTLNGKKIIQILKEFPKGEIIVDCDDSFSVTIKSKSSDLKGIYKIIGTGKEDYPEIPSISEKDAFICDQQEVKEMIRKVSYAAALDSIKPVFFGIYFISEGNGVFSMVASDSRRLSISSRKNMGNIEIKEGIIIPLKTIHELSKVLSVGTMNFQIKGAQCFFRVGNTEIITRLVDGQFPNFRQVIPKDQSVQIYVKKSKLIETIRRVMVFSKEPSYKIIITCLKDRLTLEAKVPEIGEALETLDVESNGNEKIVIGINSQYMIDSLKEIDSENIIMGVNGSMNPVTIRPENDEMSIAVIMPIQIKAGDSD
jgi:DNA polymerase III subunit beta